MKQKFVKKALAVVLSTAMTFSLSSAAQMQTALAAKKFVSLNTTFKTLKVGQSNYKLKLTNNTIGWKVTKAVSTDTGIVAVQKKAASYVTLKGKSAGRATIRVSLKTAARKKNNTKTLRCRVKVVETSTTNPTTPIDPSTPSVDPVQTTAQVTTQAELDAALKNSAVTSITINTTAAASFNIPSGQYSNVDLTVNAPNADVENSATFKSVTIKAIKNDTWTEKARGNSLRVEAVKARIVVDAAASVAGITVTSANADVAIVVNGTAAGITVSAKAKLNLTGSPAAKVPVTIAAAAAGSEIISVIPVILQAAANATIDLQQGAEESTVQVTSTSATVSVKNNTTKKITVTKADNSKSDVAAKGNLTVKPSTGTSTGSTGGSSSWGGGSWTGGGSSSGSSSSVKDYAVVYNQKELDDALANSAIRDITIKADENLYIKEGDYSKSLIVDAPNATIDNYADFKNIEIRNISENTWREFGKRNSFTVTAPRPHIVVGKGAKVRNISFNGAVKNATLEVNGTIENGVSCASNDASAKIVVRTAAGAEVKGGVSVNAKIQVDVVGTKTSEKIVISVNVQGATLFVSIPAAIKLNKDDATIKVTEGAEGTSLEFASNVDKTLIDTAVNVDKVVNGEITTIPADSKGEVTADSNEVNDDVDVPVVDGAGNEIEDDGEQTTPPTEDESTSTGDESTSTGDESTSTGDESTSTGDESTSTGDESTSTGDESTSTGDESTSTGLPQISGFEGVVSGSALIVTAGSVTVNNKNILSSDVTASVSDNSTVTFNGTIFEIAQAPASAVKLTFDVTDENGNVYTIEISIPAELTTATGLTGTATLKTTGGQ